MRPAVLLLAKALFVPLASAAPLTSIWSRSGLLHSLEDDVDSPKDASDPNLYLYLAIALILVLLGGVFAGLTIALMGQDETYLQVIATSGEGSERKHAEKVLRLLKRGKHWVLVTLLLSNVITNETLPIVLDRSLGGGWPAVLSSTILIGMYRGHSGEGVGWIEWFVLIQEQSSSVRSHLSPFASATASRLARSWRLPFWA